MSLVLVDGHYYAYRSFYAIANLTNSKGEPTNAAFGFASALMRMNQDLQPQLGAVIFDGGIPQERMETHPEYKANRKETPESLEKQIPLLYEVAQALGWKTISVEGEEADDVIASYTAATDGRVVIVNGAGDVLADSEPAVAGQRNFLSRPEIADALDRQISSGTRYSTTLGTGLLYVAVPISVGDKVLGAIRVSYSTDQVDAKVRRYWLVLLGAGLITLVLAARSPSPMPPINCEPRSRRCAFVSRCSRSMPVMP